MHRSLSILLLALAASCSGLSRPQPFPEPELIEPMPWPDTRPPLVTSHPDIEALLNSLSVRDKVAQLVMPWVAGSYAAFDDSAFQQVTRWVDSLHVGGIIVSIGSPLDVAAKINRLQRRSYLPLLVASDLEGGTAFRLNGGTAFPTNMGVGATGSELDAYQMGRVTALEGRAVGIHIAFAPVADVNNNPANPIINTRSFGEDPEQVGRLVAAEVRGLQEHGMLATVKHFPGHGDTGIDSHLFLPVITADWSRIDSVELVPFRAAVKADVMGVMSAHIAMPGVDSGRVRPATVAPNLLTGVLRDSLHFKGLVVTDALSMGALVGNYGAGEAVVLAFLAGADLLLAPADPGVAIDAMVRAVEDGRITFDRLDSSVRRILHLKEDMGIFRRRTVPLEDIPAVVGSAAFREVAQDITNRSLVLVKDSGNTVAGLRRRPRPVTIVAYGDEIGTLMTGELRTRGYPVTTFRLYPSSGPASYDSARVAIAATPVTIFATSVRAVAGAGNIALPTQVAAFIDSTGATHPTVLLSLGSPYLIIQAPRVGSYLIGWSFRPMSERAVGQALAGVTSITGTLPIAIPPLFPRGTGIRLMSPSPD